jgi:acyl-[acyl-carrier-protein]-phospholipid O-acyltransferase/long-chain-fatty-acid--[acyl-carrier-protein] ligase
MGHPQPGVSPIASGYRRLHSPLPKLDNVGLLVRLLRLLIRGVVRLLLRVWFRVRVRGVIGPHERLLIVSNHQSLLDGVLLGAFLPVNAIPVLHAAIVRHGFVRFAMRLFPHLVVETGHPLAMKTVIGLIEQGKPVLIFPEGRVTVTGMMMKIYEGPAFVAAKTGATVVPVHIDGAVYSVFSRMTGDFPRRLFPRITITIHPPESIAAPETPGAKVRRRMEAEALRKIMQRAAFTSRGTGTLFPALVDAASLHGWRRDILEDIRQEPLTYARIVRNALALGRIVSKLTVEGEFTGVLLPNVSATVSLLFGMWAMRRVPAMLNYTAGAEGLRHACHVAGLRLVITSRAFLERARLADVVAHLENVRVVCLEDLRAEFGLADKLWLILWATRFPRRAARPGSPSDTAVVVFTSGSEGRPKGVAISHDAILANLAQCRAVIEFAPRDKLMSTLPLFHMFGLTVGIFLPLFGGSRLFLYISPLHYRVVPEVIYDRDCTVLFASSTFLGNYAKYANPFDFRALRLVVAGAEKLSADVRKIYFEKFGIRVLEGYGVTETSPVLSVNTPMASKTGTVGELFPGVEYRIEPVPGIQHGGLLHVRGPNVMQGYLSEERPGTIEPVRSVFGEGWYNTGDIAEVDDAGFLTIHGRVRRFAKVAGEMVSLELAERIAAEASPECEHASAATREAGRGEIIVLFTEDPHLGREQLQQAAHALGAPELAIPRRIVHLEEIPCLGSGKKDYVALNRMAQGEGV